MKSRLREDEIVVKKLKDGWHAVRHGKSFEWSKTMYRFKLFRNPVLTNQRLLFLKDDAIKHEIPLDNITKAEYKTKLRTNPYIRLELQDGNATIIVFESLSQRIWDSIIQVHGEVIDGQMITKEWVNEINRQIRNPISKESKPETLKIIYCKSCGAEAQKEDYFCNQCGKEV